jgi:hypothetical protein
VGSDGRHGLQIRQQALPVDLNGFVARLDLVNGNVAYAFARGFGFAR